MQQLHLRAKDYKNKLNPETRAYFFLLTLGPQSTLYHESHSPDHVHTVLLYVPEHFHLKWRSLPYLKKQRV